MLEVVAYETYSFRHQTFQEYLVASALASRFISDDESTRAAGQEFAWSKHTFGKHAPTAALIEALRAKNAPETRRAVIEALVKLSEHGDIPDDVFLREIFRKSERFTSVALFQAFHAQKKHIPEKIVQEALELLPPQEIHVVIHYLSQFPELIPIFPPALVAEALSLYAADQYKAANRYKYLEKPDQAGCIPRMLPALPASSLLEALTHRNSQVRSGALLLLAAFPDSLDLKPFLDALHDPDYGVRCQAIRCLGKRSEDFPVQAIVACLQDLHLWVCRAAIEALASLGTRAPISELVALLDTPAPEVRCAAIQALRQPGLFERVPLDLFVNALEDKATVKNAQPYCKPSTTKIHNKRSSPV